MNGKYLITTDNWFFAPDGKQYRAVWGDVKIVTDKILGIKTNARSSNWFAKIGPEENYVVVAGCQIHYAVRCEARPKNKQINEQVNSGTEYRHVLKDNPIYFAE